MKIKHLQKRNTLKKNIVCVARVSNTHLKLKKADVINFFKYHNFEVPTLKNIKLVNRYSERVAYVKIKNLPWKNTV